MTTFPAPDRAGVLDVPPAVRALGRLAAVLAVGSAAVHAMLVDAADLGSLAMLGMALVCLPCAWHLWRDPSGTAWALTATVDGGMLVLHLQMLAPQTGSHGAHSAGGLLWLGAGLVGAQLATAALAAAALRRR
ncbi:hypothetical protein [Blastococcus sp. SYSU DS0617]